MAKRLLDALPVFPIEQPEVPEGIVKKKEKRNPHAVGVNDVSQVRSRKWTIAKSLKRIGRGKNHARDLDRDTARGHVLHMLNGEIPDLELGGVLIALRIKGEGKQRCSAFTKPCKITPSD